MPIPVLGQLAKPNISPLVPITAKINAGVNPIQNPRFTIEALFVSTESQARAISV